MIDAVNFREMMDKILYEYDEFTKEDYYTLLLEVSEMFLTELISMKNIEDRIIETLGPNKGEELIQDLAEIELDSDIMDGTLDPDIKIRIEALFATLDSIGRRGGFEDDI